MTQSSFGAMGCAVAQASAYSKPGLGLADCCGVGSDTPAGRSTPRWAANIAKDARSVARDGRQKLH